MTTASLTLKEIAEATKLRREACPKSCFDDAGFVPLTTEYYTRDELGMIDRERARLVSRRRAAWKKYWNH